VESCHSVAGDDGFVVFVRVTSPHALEELLQDIRRRANVTSRTTVVLHTFFEGRDHAVATRPSLAAQPV
ncbi:MAG: Lrp/AsnC family transcriptional regulator, leucine-responsive regulatory protein, partial [Pseudonocardiales bacterium]|nr:Lrp/AsnC family transcriptional regulator, leucine-responsive regulatory protein [Pseudonocardiales bacterium]